ncbi:MAG: hypothetical protein JSU73_09035 [candidate division WOR-3 bacterium]|nr:MAG: hypothetical protein JSU73_09035 [candidate division WOR-3 bacterium]
MMTLVPGSDRQLASRGSWALVTAVPALVLVPVACDWVPEGGYGRYPPDTQSQVTIEQGVWGNV